MGLLQTLSGYTIATRETGSEETDNGIEVSTAETGHRLHRAGAEASTEIGIEKVTGLRAIIVEAEVEAHETNDRDGIPHHQTMRL